MENAAFYFSLMLSFFSSCTLALISKKKVLTKIWNKDRTWIYAGTAIVLICLFFGTFGFHGLVSLLKLFGIESALGHGEVYVAAFIFNIGLAVVYLVVFRILLNWRPQKW